MPTSSSATEPGGIGAENIWRDPLPRLFDGLDTSGGGLDNDQARQRLAKYGPNDAATVARSPLWAQFLARFRNPLVLILLVASGLSAATGDATSFIVILIIVTISMTLDFVQEVRAQNARAPSPPCP